MRLTRVTLAQLGVAVSEIYDIEDIRRAMNGNNLHPPYFGKLHQGIEKIPGDILGLSVEKRKLYYLSMRLSRLEVHSFRFVKMGKTEGLTYGKDPNDSWSPGSTWIWGAFGTCSGVTFYRRKKKYHNEKRW
jgi:hypothetical protein